MLLSGVLGEEQWAAEVRRNKAGLGRAGHCVLTTERQKFRSPHGRLTVCENCAVSTLKELEKRILRFAA